MCRMLVFPAKTETMSERKSKADDNDDHNEGEDIKMMIKNCVNIYKIPIYKYVSKNGSVRCRCRCRHCRVNVKCLNRAKTNYLLYNGNTL